MSKRYQKEYRENMSDEQKQRYRDKQKKYRDNMTDEQKLKRREANKRYRDNMSDEQKQKLRDYQKDYTAKKLNDKIIDDNDFYYVSIIIKLKNIVPIKDINSKVCSQAYLEGRNFIDDSNNKND